MKINEHLALFLENKNTVLLGWMNYQPVEDVLNSLKIDKDQFVIQYANQVFDFYMEVIEDDSKIGNCPALKDLIVYLKDNNVSSSQLFVLCNGFRYAIVQLAYDKSIINLDIEKEINYLFENNFKGVLDIYFNTINEVELKLAKTVKMMSEHIISSQTDTKGIITHVSDAFCKISGYSAQELIGQPHNIIRHPNTPSRVFKDLWDTIQSGKTWRGEIENMDKNGKSYWVDATIEPIFKDDTIIGYNAVRQDITSKKLVQSQQHMIIEQSKSAAMGEMISMIAHQWRQPLQAVSILVQKLPLTKMIDGELTDEALDQVVEDVSVQLNYMSKTIDDFRNFFKPNKEKEHIVVSELIAKVKDFLAYMLKIDQIDFIVEYENDVDVRIYINEIVQVLINIIKNARDAMIENKIENRKIIIRFAQIDNDLVLTIEDNAGGIPQDVLGKIFEPYFSTKFNKNGTGLGLYMSKTIVEEHSHGMIKAQNGENGAIFTINLPL